MNTLAPLLLIESSSYLQVTKLSITSRTCSKFGQIGPRTAELAALERLENPYRLIMGKCFDHSSSFIFAGNEDVHKSLDGFKFRPDTTSNSIVICPCASEN